MFQRASLIFSAGDNHFMRRSKNNIWELSEQGFAELEAILNIPSKTAILVDCFISCYLISLRVSGTCEISVLTLTFYHNAT